MSNFEWDEHKSQANMQKHGISFEEAKEVFDVSSAINLLKSGGNLDQTIITDLVTAKVKMPDALLLARNGYVIPEDNVVYDDSQIQYDPDFDAVTWGKPVPFKKLKQSLEAGDQLAEAVELIVKLQIKSTDVKEWLTKNEGQINIIDMLRH